MSRRIGRGFFNVTEKKAELAEAKRAEELRIQQEIQEEKISFLKETLNLRELIAYRDRWLKLGIRKNMQEHIKNLIGDDAGLIEQKFGTNDENIFRAISNTELDVSKINRFNEIKQIELNYDDVTYNRFKSCIKQELIKLHEAKNKIVDLLVDNDELGISTHFKEVFSDINDKLELLTEEIRQLKLSNQPKEDKITTRSTIGVFEPGIHPQPIFRDPTAPTQQYQYTDESDGSLKSFLNNNLKIKQFINTGGQLEFQPMNLEYHLCVVRNYQLIDRLTSVYPKLFHHFLDIVKLKFKNDSSENYDKKFNNEYWYINTMINSRELDPKAPDKYTCGSYDLMFLDAIKETLIYNKIILVPSVRYCRDVKSYLYIDKVDGYKTPDNKNQLYYKLKQKAIKIKYKPMIELDIINYYQLNELVCFNLTDVWYDYEDQKTFIGNYEYEYD